MKKLEVLEMERVEGGCTDFWGGVSIIGGLVLLTTPMGAGLLLASAAVYSAGIVSVLKACSN